MSPVQAVTSVFAKYATFQGRAMRSEFWWFVAFYVVVSIILGALAVQMDNDTTSLILGLFYLATILPYIAVGARRLHDRNRTGWWQLISLIPFGGFLLLYWWAMPGDAAANRYGPPPTATPQAS